MGQSVIFFTEWRGYLILTVLTHLRKFQGMPHWWSNFRRLCKCCKCGENLSLEAHRHRATKQTKQRRNGKPSLTFTHSQTSFFILESENMLSLKIGHAPDSNYTILCFVLGQDTWLSQAVPHLTQMGTSEKGNPVMEWHPIFLVVLC